LVVVAPELLLKQTVVMLDFLLFLRGQPPVGELSALNVHARGIVAALQRPGRAGGFVNERAQAAIDPRLGTVVTGHAKSNSRTENDFRGCWCRHKFVEAPYNGETVLGLQVVQVSVP